MSKKQIVGSLSALVLAGVPVAAAADSHGNNNSQGENQPAKSHKCQAHPVSYRVSGTLDSSPSLTVTGTGGHKTITAGSVTITVTSANDAAKKAGVAKGSHQTYNVTGAKVTYSHRVTQPNPAAGTHTVIKGTITVVSKKCTNPVGAGVVTIKRVSFSGGKSG